MISEEKISLPSRLYFSRRIYKKRIDKGWIFYAPDVAGMPTVVSGFAHQICTSFDNGALVEDIIRLFTIYNGCDYREITKVIRVLVNCGFLRSFPIPVDYLIHDLCSVDKVTTIEIWLRVAGDHDIEYGCGVVNRENISQNTKTKKNVEAIDRIIEKISFTIAAHPTIKTIKVNFAGIELTLIVKKIEYFYDKLTEKLRNYGVRLWLSVLVRKDCFIDVGVINFLKRYNIEIGIFLGEYSLIEQNRKNGDLESISKIVECLLENSVTSYIAATVSEKNCRSLKDLVAWSFRRNIKIRLSIAQNTYANSISDNQYVAGYEKYIDVLITNFEEVFGELERDIYSIRFGEDDFQICELRFNNPSFVACDNVRLSHVVINEQGFLTCYISGLQGEKDVVFEESNLFNSAVKTFDFFPSLRKNCNQQGKICFSCKWFPVCVGGYSIGNIITCNQPDVIPVLHDFYMYLIPRYIEFYGRKLLQQAHKNGIEDFYILMT